MIGLAILLLVFTVIYIPFVLAVIVVCAKEDIERDYELPTTEELVGTTLMVVNDMLD